MPPRPYNSDLRQLQAADLKARIAAAAAELHATQGALATSYAQIAQHAGVSLPTVYKHFPTLDDLVTACTGHVFGQAPAFPDESILAAPDIQTAASILVASCDATHAYFEPWRSWNEQSRIPVLQQIYETNRTQLVDLCKALLQRHGAPGDIAQAAAVWESILSFDFWRRLVRDHKLSRAAAREHQHLLLLAAVGPRPARDSSPRPTRKNRA